MLPQWIAVLRCLFAGSVFALCLTASAQAQGFVIAGPDTLGRYWRTSAPAVVLMEVGNAREDAYGCIAIGFMIDRAGRMTAARPLRRAFAAKVSPQRAQALTRGVANAAPMLAQYVPSPENSQAAEVFTALAIPILGRKHAAGLSPAQRDAIAAQLRPSCEISDLAAWVDSHDMRMEPPIEAAPAIDVQAAGTR